MMYSLTSLSIFGILLSLDSVTSLPVTSPGSTKFGVILDAGSSSTKVRGYSWIEGTHGIPRMHEVLYQKYKPGIADFSDRIDEIAEYMLEILNFLKDEIPPEKWVETPVYFMATAGLLLLLLFLLLLLCLTKNSSSA